MSLCPSRAGGEFWVSPAAANSTPTQLRGSIAWVKSYYVGLSDQFLRFFLIRSLVFGFLAF